MQTNFDLNKQNFSGRIYGLETLSPQCRGRISKYVEDLKSFVEDKPCDIFIKQSKKGSIMFSTSRNFNSFIGVPKGSKNYLDVAKQSIEAYKQELKEYIKFFSDNDRKTMWAKFRLQTNKINQ